MNELALFTGSGGGLLGSKLLGWRTVCAVENNGYARDVLVARQNDGSLEPFPIWDDVCTFKGEPWREIVDVVSGGFPCQDLSTQSAVHGNISGIDGERSGLWTEMARIIGEVRPNYILLENSPMLLVRGIDRVCGRLASMGYNLGYGVIGANTAGLDHPRKRIWIVGIASHITGDRLEGWDNSNKEGPRNCASRPVARFYQDKIRYDIPAPNAFGASNGLACRMDRLRCIGNGQVPRVVQIAWETVSKLIQEKYEQVDAG